MEKEKNSEEKIVPRLRFPEFKESWEQRKAKSLFVSVNEKGFPELPVLSATQDRGMVIRSEAGYQIQHDNKNEEGYKRVQPGDFVIHLRSFQGGFAHSSVLGIASPAYTVFRFISPDEQNDWFWKIIFMSPQFIKRLETVTYGIRDGRSISYSDFLEMDFFVPKKTEQKKISLFFKNIDSAITLHQRKLDRLKVLKKALLQKMFPSEGMKVPEVRFPSFTESWEQRKLSDEFERVNERNDGTLGKDRWISVAKMYFQDEDKVQSNNIDTRTYVMREGDIAFEGHPNSEFKYGRFVANDIGTGVISELFPIYRHKMPYNNQYWKHAIQIERIMQPIFAKSITSSGNSSNKLNPHHFLRESISVPSLEEQKQIGTFFQQIDSAIALHQRRLDHYKLLKKGLLQQMFPTDRKEG